MNSGLVNRREASAAALIDESGEVVTYAALESLVAEAREAMGDASLILIVGGNDVETLVHYLAGLEAGVVPLLLGAAISEAHARGMMDTYRPDLVLAPAEGIAPTDAYRELSRRGRYALYRRSHREELPLHPDLALLLPTSGSTGSPKLVRLSRRNLLSNAGSIADYLGIGPDERAITTLPYNYSYGLSVINSHLHAGATVILSERSLVDRGFWDMLRRERATSFAGVPYTYDMLLKLRLERMDLPSVRTLTQAGGRLAQDKASAIGRACEARGMRFFTMYGQTEATARMSYLPPDLLQSKPGSIGRPIPGGAFQLRDETGAVIDRPHEVGELIYSGDNVSLGYAQCRDDLARGDDNRGVLCTGDLARVDDDGFYFLTGRKSRFLKVYGVRISIDDVERLAAELGFEAAATGSDDLLKIGVVCDTHPDLDALRTRLAGILGINQAGLRLQRLGEIPRLTSGKVDYKWIDQTT